MNYEKVRKLAEEHWKYTSELISFILRIYNITMKEELLEALHFLYVKAMIHGYKHAVKDLKNLEVERNEKKITQ